MLMFGRPEEGPCRGGNYEFVFIRQLPIIVPAGSEARIEPIRGGHAQAAGRPSPTPEAVECEI
jgi:hypothetical protein